MNLYKDVKHTVSIVLPSYNRAYIINRAIQSVLKQTFTDWELIIIDDGSTDKTYDLCKNYTLKFSNIKYFKQSNKGLPLSLNKGISTASGKYITFLGSDDEYLPEHLKLRIDFLKQHPEIELLHGGVKIIGNKYVKDKNDFSKKIHLNDCVIGGTFFGGKEVFQKLNGFRNIDYSEDSDFYNRAMLAGIKIEKVNFKTYIYYRNTADSICNSI